MKKKNLKTKHIIIILIFLILGILTIFSTTLKEDRQLNKLESLIKDSVTSIEKIIFYPFNFIEGKIKDYKDLVNIREKYQLLLDKVDKIQVVETENIELRKQLESMKKELNIDYTINEYEYLNATVIIRNVTNWRNTITIDKGSYNGVIPDMAVVNNQGLIGKVISTTAFTSEVRLITSSDTSNKISITINNNNNNINGLINRYDYQHKYLEIEGVSNTERVSINSKVYTNGLGGIFPSGILIGTISNIKIDEYGLAKIIEVEPSVNFDDINYVAVLKRKEIKHD